MYSKTPTGRNPRGTVTIRDNRGSIQLVFRHEGKRHYLSMGLPYNEVNLEAARAKARLIETDIAWNRVDLTKYKTTVTLSTGSKPDLMKVWQLWLKNRESVCSENTMHQVYGQYTRYLDRCPYKGLDEAVAVRDWCIKELPLITTKRLIQRVSAACNHAVKQGMISTNTFNEMAMDIPTPKKHSKEYDIFPFSAMERDRILIALETNEFCLEKSAFSHSHYAPFIKFLFATGCRPSEAQAMEWGQVSKDFKTLTFDKALIQGKDGRKTRKGLKSQEKRRFPANAPLQQFLRSHKPKEAKPSDLVFPSHKNIWIDLASFRRNTWVPVLRGLNIPYRKIYQCRHTWITLAIANGVTIVDCARLAGNSPKVILEHYAGNRHELFVPEF